MQRKAPGLKHFVDRVGRGSGSSVANSVTKVAPLRGLRKKLCPFRTSLQALTGSFLIGTSHDVRSFDAMVSDDAENANKLVAWTL